MRVFRPGLMPSLAVALVSGLFAILFLGGWHGPFPLPVPWAENEALFFLGNVLNFFLVHL